MLVTPVRDATEQLGRLRGVGTSVVFVDAESMEFSSVTVDNVLGGRLAVEHLLAMGCRRIAFVGSSRSSPQVADRYLGARRAVVSHGGASLEVIDVHDHDVRSGAAVANRLLARRVRDRPDAVFAANDLVAIGIVQALSMSATVRIPDDLAVIGYDDIEFARSAPVALSSIRQPNYEMGRIAMRIAIDEAADPRRSPNHEKLAPILVARDSTLTRSARARP